MLPRVAPPRYVPFPFFLFSFSFLFSFPFSLSPFLSSARCSLYYFFKILCTQAARKRSNAVFDEGRRDCRGFYFVFAYFPFFFLVARFSSPSRPPSIRFVLLWGDATGTKRMRDTLRQVFMDWSIIPISSRAYIWGTNDILFTVCEFIYIYIYVYIK